MPMRVKGIRRTFPWENLWHCALFAAQDVELVGVTASGNNEKKKLAELLDSVQPDLREIFDSMPCVLAPPNRDPPERLVKHHIFVSTSCVPAARSAYPMGDTKLEAMHMQMKELVEEEIGCSFFDVSLGCPNLVCRKRWEASSFRMCVDFRDLNALTKKDRFPLHD